MHQVKNPDIRPLSFVGLRLLFGRPGGEPYNDLYRARHSVFWGAILGIGISLIPLYIVLFVSNGMIQGITDRYLETKTSHLQMNLPFDFDASQRNALIQDVSRIPGVISTFFEIDGIGLAASQNGSTSAQIRGLDGAVLHDKGFNRFISVDEGQMYPNRQNEVVLGRYLARKLEVKTGDSVTIITLKNVDSTNYLPKLAVFRVTGIISSGYRELDANWFIIQSDAALRLLNSTTAYAFLGIKISKPYGPELDRIASEVSHAGEKYGLAGEQGARVRTWREIEKSLFQSFSSTRSVLVLIMVIAIIVAALNLASALSTFVIEHRAEIAIIRSFGVSRTQTALIFLLGGTATGAIGCIAGSLAGIVISIFINQIIGGIQAILDFASKLLSTNGQAIKLLNPDYYLEHIPITVDWRFVISILLSGIALSAIASLLPAMKSTSIAPAELIRHE
jgi:lipoprotein-releasing system permease protein